MATKCGRFIEPHVSQGYTPEVLTGFVEKSLKNTGFDTLDLVQLHCPPTEVYYRPEIFETFEKLKDQGKIRHLGVSVEKVEEALKAIEYPNVVSVQIIFNIFRQRPSDLFFQRAQEMDKAIIVRVPLASGLLSGKFNENTVFDKTDHRNYNRNGDAFDKGETFAGVPFEVGLAAVRELEKVLPAPLAESALRWILGSGEVSTVIPGASRPDQVAPNLSASRDGSLTPDEQMAVQDIYEQLIKPHVHHRW